MEEYKEIDYLETQVQVSKDGNIIWNGYQRNIYYNADGYAVCAIKIPNKGWRSVRVARLVALAYLPNPDNLPEVNHKDYNRANSNVNNLEWISRKDNVRYSKCNMPDYHGENNPNYGNRKLSQRYQQDKRYALEKQSRRGLQNGRCRKISVYENDRCIVTFDYIVDCCHYLCERFGLKMSDPLNARTYIDRSIRLNKPFRGLTFVKE